MTTFFRRLATLDRRWWFLVLALVVAWPIISPIGLPTSVSDWSRQTYSVLEQVQPGDLVWISNSYSPGGSPDVHAGAEVLAKILLSRGAKLIMASFTPMGDSFAESIARGAEAAGYIYGVDLVNMGFVAGAESGLAAFAANPRTLLAVDYRGTPASQLPILQRSGTASDFRLTVLIATGMPGVEEWTRQVTMPYSVPTVLCVNTNGVTRAIPYLQSGQIAGLVAGLKGSAEVEILSGFVGSAAAGMDAQSLGHLFMLAMIILANIGYLTERTARSSTRGEAVRK